MTRLTLWLLRGLLPGALLLVTAMVLIGGWLPRPDWDVLAYIQPTYFRQQPRLHLIDFTRSLDVNITPPGMTYLSPDWSPDGRQLVAIHLNQASLVRLNLNGQVIQPVLTERDAYISPQWSPDGRQIAFSVAADSAHKSAIFITTLTESGYGDKPRLLTDYHTPSNFWWNEANEAAVTWSANSRSLIFTTSEGALDAVDPRFYRTRLYEISVDGGETRTIRDDVQNIIAPTLSPDGSQIAFISNWDTGILRLYVMNRDGSDMRQLENLFFESIPAWSRDGKEIGYWLREQSLSFYTIDLATGAKRLRYSTEREMLGADWRP